MSAALAPQLVPHPRTTRRPDLRLVPAVPSVRRPATPRPHLRISRFGRLLLTLAALAVVTAVAITVLGTQSASAGVDHTVTVRAGQTLSELAARELPQLSIPEGVAQIQLANHLSSSEVHSGQELAIPALP